ncbi:hypothetical protein [Petrachloros mirabilis]
MKHDLLRMCARRTVTLGILSGILLVAVTACSSEQPKPMAQPTPDQVRSHSDRTFDKLKQEEQERTAQPAVPQ